MKGEPSMLCQASQLRRDRASSKTRKYPAPEAESPPHVQRLIVNRRNAEQQDRKILALEMKVPYSTDLLVESA